MKVLQTLCGIGIALMVLPTLRIGAQTDVPSTYDEVANAYTTLIDEMVNRGSVAAQQFLNQEFEALREQFSAETADALSQQALEQTFAQIDTNPIGGILLERVMPIGGATAYMASYIWGDSALNLSIYFDDSGQIVGLSIVPSAPLPDDPAADYESETVFRLPFDGLWYTAWGGRDRLLNYHVDAPPQRHAYDFVVWQDGSTFSGDGTRNEDYYAYGQPALAPADGTVITVVDDLPDNQPQIETNEQHPAGNHVVIQTGESEFVFLAHLQPGSITVEPGQTVESGQQIGLVGNSGNSSEPHLHIHLQDQPEMFEIDESGQAGAFTDAMGLPLRFSNYHANGESTEMGEPVGGTFVLNG